MKESPGNRGKGKAASKTAWMKKDIGELVATIACGSITACSGEVTSRNGFDVMCSYNWQIDGKAILVPGADHSSTYLIIADTTARWPTKMDKPFIACGTET